MVRSVVVFVCLILIFSFQNCSPGDESLLNLKQRVSRSLASSDLSVSLSQVRGVAPSSRIVTVQGSCSFSGYKSAKISWELYPDCVVGDTGCTKDVVGSVSGVFCTDGEFHSRLNLFTKNVTADTDFVVETKILPYSEDNEPVDNALTSSYFKVRSAGVQEVIPLASEELDFVFTEQTSSLSVTVREGVPFSLSATVFVNTELRTSGREGTVRWEKLNAGGDYDLLREELSIGSQGGEVSYNIEEASSEDAGRYKLLVDYGAVDGGTLSLSRSLYMEVKIVDTRLPRVKLEAAVDGVVSGWAYDPDTPEQPISYVVFLNEGGYHFSGSAQSTRLGTYTTSVASPDLNKDRGLTGKHKFVETLGSKYIGKWIFIRGVDNDTGELSKEYWGRKMFGETETPGANEYIYHSGVLD